MKKLKVCVAIIAAIGLSASSGAQALSKQDAPPRPRQTKQSQKPGPEPLEKPVSTTPIQEPEDAMRRAITDLSTQIGLLTGEMRKLRRETERNSGTMELLLTEDRLSKLEDKIQETADRKAQLDAREQEINRRTRNIPNELMLRGGLRRDEAEAAIRGELQRSLDDVHSQQAIAQQRLGELNEQAARFRARVEALRKKLEIPEVKGVKEEK
jgi:chromosome segregation ATPase